MSDEIVSTVYNNETVQLHSEQRDVVTNIQRESSQSNKVVSIVVVEALSQEDDKRGPKTPEYGKRILVQSGLGVVASNAPVENSRRESAHLRKNAKRCLFQSKAIEIGSDSSTSSKYVAGEHPCNDEECDSDPDDGEHITITADNKRHRNYQFNFALNEFENMEAYFVNIWTENTRYIIYQKEMSDSGYRHIQAYVEFKNAVSFNKAKILLGVKFVQPVEKCEKRRAMLYASKIETRLPGTEPREIGIPSINIVPTVRKNNDIWIEALNAGSRDKAMKIIKFNRPETYLCKKRIISESLDQEFGIKTAANFTEFNIPFKNVWDSMCHVFIGPTNIGKTNYALAHFKCPVHVKGLQNFGRISDNPSICDGVVIDDIPLCKLPSNELLGICDLAYENNINIKYSIGYIPQYMPRIICLNSITSLISKKIEPEILEAINRRIIIHNFDTKLYDNYIDLNKIQSVRKNQYAPRCGLNVEASTVLTDAVQKSVTSVTGSTDTTS